jgi:hypothetical protein
VSWPPFVIKDLAFADPTTGVAAGGAHADPNRGSFVRTTDGGAD